MAAGEEERWRSTRWRARRRRCSNAPGARPRAPPPASGALSLSTLSPSLAYSSYTAILSAHSCHGRPWEALSLFSTFTGARPDVASFLSSPLLSSSSVREAGGRRAERWRARGGRVRRGGEENGGEGDDFPDGCGWQMRARRCVGKKRERGPVRRRAAWRGGEEAGGMERGKGGGHGGRRPGRREQ
uniref:Uncharacterized protein n=1 Tax=Oryza sativa subsp. japonica TaxID=39947 RepID=Q6ZGX2_ORYSJ|nr:hypothetical protein [Oryza sativa Japonica Group]